MNPILKEIKNSFDYLDYKDNWDEEGAKPVNEKCFVEAINFLLYFINHNINIVTPHISPLNDGTIDIHFVVGEQKDINSTHLLINFNENYFTYYGEVGENKHVINESTENAYGHGYARVQTILNNWVLTHLTI